MFPKLLCAIVVIEGGHPGMLSCSSWRYVFPSIGNWINLLIVVELVTLDQVFVDAHLIEDWNSFCRNFVRLYAGEEKQAPHHVQVNDK